MNNELLIIIPAYNEEENIERFIKSLKQEKMEGFADILVINDGSTDDTEGVVRGCNINIINKPLNMGYGSTLQLGYKYASKYNYKYVIQIDADGQHDVSNICVIYNQLSGKNNAYGEKPDIVIGSRFLSTENEMKVSFVKKIAIRFFEKTTKFFTGKVITDPTSGLQGLSRNAFDHYSHYGNFDYLYPDINMIIQMIMLGFKIQEVPAKMYERQLGESMHSGIVKPIMYMILMSVSTIGIILRQKRNEYNFGYESDEKI